MITVHRVDWLRITECFDRHGVEYLIVGGVGAQIHGAARPTNDFNSLPKTSEENLGRLAAALSELGAYLRVEGLSEEDARALPVPVQVDGVTLARMDISTWRTNAGDLDVLTAIPTRAGRAAPAGLRRRLIAVAGTPRKLRESTGTRWYSVMPGVTRNTP